MSDITICSMYHSKDSSDLLTLNWDLTTNLNPGVKILWLVGDNRPKGGEPIEPPKGGFTFIQGYHSEDLKRVYNWPILAAYHGGLCLNALLPYCKTKYVLFLDSDFFVVRRDWLKELIAHMEEKKPAMFGAPWHPKYPGKPRYFPTHAFSCYNSDIIPVWELDFNPGYDFKYTHTSTNPGAFYPPEDPPRSKNVLYKAFFNLRKRLAIGSSRDVTWLIRESLKNSGLWVECAQPVWKEQHKKSKASRFLDMFLPERFSFTPKRPHYFTDVGFKEKGYPDFYELDMEEYMFEGEPYGIHIRNTHRRKDIARKFTQLAEGLKSSAKMS
jgi:hypothetical protein